MVHMVIIATSLSDRYSNPKKVRGYGKKVCITFVLNILIRLDQSKVNLDYRYSYEFALALGL